MSGRRLGPVAGYRSRIGKAAHCFVARTWPFEGAGREGTLLAVGSLKFSTVTRPRISVLRNFDGQDADTLNGVRILP